ncbi:MAG: radical SAM protein [Deltaproteobacteria bacterium]|nr:radical SAM protein [Deltaproteobacteria bacterium]
MKEINLDQLTSRLAQRVRRSPQIISAMIELTYGCNLRCVHCYNPTHQARNELSTGQVLKILDALQAQGCFRIGFTGGEFLTRKDALEIIRYAKKLGFVVQLLTNATLVTAPIADQIKALSPASVDISVYGATKETYEKVTGVPGSFKKFVTGVDLLCKRNVTMMLKLVLMTLNVHELDLMKRFARERRLRYQFSTQIHPKVDGSQSPLAYRLAVEQAFAIWRQEAVDPWIRSEQGVKWMEANGGEEECGGGKGLFPCACGKNRAAITPHGKLNLCLSVYEPRYDLTRGSLKEGWQTLVAMTAKARPGPEFECLECPLTRYCGRVTGDGWLEHKKFDGPCLSHFREMAEQKKDFWVETQNRRET